MPEEEKVKIAVLETEVKGLREQHKSQTETLHKRIDKFEGSLDGIQADIRGIAASMNKGKGAWIVGLMVAGGIGAATLKIISSIFTKAML